jgi:hypothetical protein
MDVTSICSGPGQDHATTRAFRAKASACSSLLDSASVISPLAAPRRFRGVVYPTLDWFVELMHPTCMWESSTAPC